MGFALSVRCGLSEAWVLVFRCAVDWERLGFCALSLSGIGGLVWGFRFFDILGLPKRVRICLADIIIVTCLLFITTKMLLFTFLFSVY